LGAAGDREGAAEPETVLVVDDEPAVCELLRTMLAGAGYCVLAATGGNEALALCRSHPHRIDLALVDVVMPGMTGPELVLALAVVRPEARFMYLSGYGTQAIATFDRTTPFLAKPFSPDTLLRRVRAAIDGTSVDENDPPRMPGPSPPRRE
jgi:CheY-like chemotaxis protein